MNAPNLDLPFENVVNIDASAIFEALLLALVLGIVVAGVYRWSVAGRIIPGVMSLSMVMLSMTSAMVMRVIGNNIARAFSLVGALAIIRFRTRLRSPWDITFMFFALAVGISTGVMAWRVAVIGTITISLAVMALQVVPVAGLSAEIRLLRVDMASFEGAEEHIDHILERHARRRWLEEARSFRFGETLSYRYRVILAHDERFADLIRELSEVEGVERVMLYADADGTGETE